MPAKLPAPKVDKNYFTEEVKKKEIARPLAKDILKKEVQL